MKNYPSYQEDADSILFQFAQLGQVAAGFFHDAANLVAALKLDLEQLAQLPEKTPAVRRQVIVHRAQDSLVKIESLIAAVRQPITMAEPEEVDVAEVVEEVAKIEERQAQRRGVKIEVAVPAQPSLIKLHRVALFQVLLNIIANAIESYDQRPAATMKVVQVAVVAMEQTIEITVQDWGAGMNKAAQEKVFQPFHSNKSGAGRGVGLYITRQQLRTVLGGELRFVSQLNQGTTFTISLPRR